MSGLGLAGLVRLGEPVSILLRDLLGVLDRLLGELVGMLYPFLVDLAVLHTVLCFELLAVEL